MAKRNYKHIEEELEVDDLQIKRIKKNTANTDQQTTSMLEINTYCLLDIFKLLELGDQIRCAATCPGLMNFYHVEIAKAYKNFSQEYIWAITELEPADLKRFLKSSAEFMEEADLSSSQLGTDITEILFRYGVHIKEVNLKGKHKHLKNLLANGQSVESLNLSCCELTDVKIKELQQLPNLRVLRLESNEELRGEYLASLNNLEELYLANNSSLAPEYIREIAQSCTKLRILDIKDFHMDAETALTIGQHCQQLETLRFNNEYTASFNGLTKLPQLRRLAMKADLPFLQAFAADKAEQLEDLAITTDALETELVEAIAQFKNLKILYCETDKVGESLNVLSKLKKLEKLAIVAPSMMSAETAQNDMLLEVFKSCTNLNYMAILCVRYIPESFIFSAIEILKERSAMLKEESKAPAKPFLLVVDEECISDAILEDQRYLEASSILELHITPYSFFDFENDKAYEC